MDATGKIGEPITSSAGLVIDCTNALVIELLAVEDADKDDSERCSTATWLVALALVLAVIRHTKTQQRGGDRMADNKLSRRVTGL